MIGQVIRKIWKSRGPSGRKVKHVAYGYNVWIDGKRERRFDSAWTEEDAGKALAARVLNLERPRPSAASGLTRAHAAERYLAAKARKRSLREDRRLLGHLMAEFGTEMPLADLTANRISEYKARRLAAASLRRKDDTGKGLALSAASINRPLALLRHLLRLAHEEWEVLPAVPRIKLEKEPEGRIRWLEQDAPDEESRLLVACEKSGNPTLAAIVTMALETGMRQDEVMGLTWDRVDLSRGMIRLERTKNGRRREVPMRQAVYDALAPLRAEALATLEPDAEGRKRELRGSVWPSRRFPRKAWDGVIERAGIEDFHFHDCRHHFASWFMMRGGSLQALQKILGHASLAMTQRYAHLSPEYLRAEIEKTAGTRFIGTSLAQSAKIADESRVSPRNAGVAQWQSN
jgi:integrase